MLRWLFTFLIMIGATVTQIVEIGPQPGRQTQFLSSPADITIYGGSAGGGKTWGLTFEPVRHIDNPGFGAVIFRRTYAQVTMEGGIWNEAENIYPSLGGVQNQSNLEWRFPSGARVKFGHLQHEKNKQDYQGAQIALLGFDQLEHFSESMFFYMLSRNRSTCGVKPYVRATVNPDPDSFVAKFIDWWIAEDGYADLSRAGKIRYFVRVHDELQWADTTEELKAKYPDIPPKSASFIPASVYDNKILMRINPEYLANLHALSLIERERLLGDKERGGNWKIRPEAGKVFNKSWFEIVDAVPAGGVDCRFWDFAATEKKMAKQNPDYTASVLIRHVRGIWYVMDCTAEQIGTTKIERDFRNLSFQDAERAHQESAQYKARWEQEPASAGKRESVRLTRMLAGLDARGIPARGDKITRAKPLAAQAEVGNVKLLRGSWNEKWLNHMHNQPDAPHDDIMDASSGAFTELTEDRTLRVARKRTNAR